MKQKKQKEKNTTTFCFSHCGIYVNIPTKKVFLKKIQSCCCYLRGSSLPLGSTVGEQIAASLSLAFHGEVVETERVWVIHDLGQLGRGHILVHAGSIDVSVNHFVNFILKVKVERCEWENQGVGQG